MNRVLSGWPLLGFAALGLLASVVVHLAGIVLAITHQDDAAVAGLGLFGLLPALVATGWTAIALRGRRHRRWRALTGAAGLLEVAIAAAAAEVLFGAPALADRSVPAALVVIALALAAMGAVPAAALLLVRRRAGWPAGWSVAAAVVWAAAAIVTWFSTTWPI
jgi:hypothetical protein